MIFFAYANLTAAILQSGSYLTYTLKTLFENVFVHVQNVSADEYSQNSRILNS